MLAISPAAGVMEECWEKGCPGRECTTVHITFAYGVLRIFSILELLLKGCKDGKRFVKGVLNQP